MAITMKMNAFSPNRVEYGRLPDFGRFVNYRANVIAGKTVEVYGQISDPLIELIARAVLNDEQQVDIRVVAHVPSCRRTKKNYLQGAFRPSQYCTGNKTREAIPALGRFSDDAGKHVRRIQGVLGSVADLDSHNDAALLKSLQASSSARHRGMDTAVPNQMPWCTWTTVRQRHEDISF
nr:hypothetical protein [Arthrobacter sp. M2012083]